MTSTTGQYFDVGAAVDVFAQPCSTLDDSTLDDS